MDLLENIFGYPETWASKDFEAALWPYSLLDPEHEPEVEKAANLDQAGTSEEGVPEVSGNTGYHCSLKQQASASFEMPAGKGKAFRKPSSVPIQEATAFLVISEKAITMTGISGSDLLIDKAEGNRVFIGASTVDISQSKSPRSYPCTLRTLGSLPPV